jgi:hypothetical protein
VITTMGSEFYWTPVVRTAATRTYVTESPKAMSDELAILRKRCVGVIYLFIEDRSRVIKSSESNIPTDK